MEIIATETYVNANPYGVDLHISCFKQMSAFDIVKMLQLDDIKKMYSNNWQDSAKICYMSEVGYV